VESGQLRDAAASGRVLAGPRARRVKRGPLRSRAKVVEPVPDEPLAVVAVGPEGRGRTDLLGALLNAGAPLPRVPDGSFLVVTHGPAGACDAYLPGYRQPHPYPTELPGGGSVLPRPPRRVELTLPDPLLRHFALVDTPDTGTLRQAGARVVLEAAGRGGALLFVISADRALGEADLNLLDAAARIEVPVFFVVTPGPGGWSTAGADRAEDDGGRVPAGADRAVDPAPRSDRSDTDDDPDPASVAVDAHRATLLDSVPGLTSAAWFAADPETSDTAFLRRALVEWAAHEGLRRASGNPPVAPGENRTVRVVRDADASGWEDRLDRQTRARAQRVRQHLALELANIHLRCVQQIIFGAGCSGLPDALDREVQALSLIAVAECESAVAGILHEAATRVFGEVLDEGVRRRVASAVRRGFADHRAGRDLDRMLLVTSTGGVATVIGLAEVTALAAYPAGTPNGVVLPPIGVALSSGCYQLWRNPKNADVGKARSWLQRALREIDLELSREVARRFDAVRLSLGGVLADAVDHGILLA
jgi:hypothetical protein